MDTTPALPLEKSPPTGMTVKTRKAGTNARYGARRNTKGSARSGWIGSLKNDLMPSARVCRIPNGPALFGPMRFCMPGDHLALEPDHEHGGDEQEGEADDDLEDGDPDDGRVDLALVERVAVRGGLGKHRHARFSRRRSMTGAVESSSAPAVEVGWLKGSQAVPAGDARIGLDLQHQRGARARHLQRGPRRGARAGRGRAGGRGGALPGPAGRATARWRRRRPRRRASG